MERQALVVVVDAVLAHVVGAVELELLLDLHLDRQAVGVPAEAALDRVAAHGPVPRDDVLQGAGEQVTVVRGAGGEGRAVVEDEVLVAADRALENLAVFPELEDGLLEGREVGTAFRLVEHGESPCACAQRRLANRWSPYGPVTAPTSARESSRRRPGNARVDARHVRTGCRRSWPSRVRVRLPPPSYQPLMRLPQRAPPLWSQLIPPAM